MSFQTDRNTSKYRQNNGSNNNQRVSIRRDSDKSSSTGTLLNGSVLKSGGESRPQSITVEDVIIAFDIKADTKIYRYGVTITHMTKERNIPEELQVMSKLDDPRARQLCYSITSHVMKTSLQNILFAYDNQETLISNSQFDDVTETIVKKDLPEETRILIPGNGIIIVKIIKDKNMSIVYLNNLNQYKAGERLLNENRSVLQMLEIILFQGAINSLKYDVVANGKLIQKKEKKLKSGYSSRIGVSKGIRMIEMETKDSNGNSVKKIKPAMILGGKHFIFHSTGLFSEVVTEFLEIYHFIEEEPFVKAEEVFKNIKLSPINQPNRILKFTKFTSKFCSKLTITNRRTGEAVSIDAPGAAFQEDGDFALESLQVLPNQLVDLHSIPTDIFYDIYDQNDVDSQIYFNNSIAEVRPLIFNNEIMNAFGISSVRELAEKIIVLQIERQERPTILLRNKNIGPQEDGCFYIGFGNKYYHPATIEKWAVLFPINVKCEKVTFFVDEFIKIAKDRGMIFFMNQPTRIKYSKITVENFYEIFSYLERHGIHNVVMIDKEKNSTGHGILKLMEGLFKIITQHIALESFKKMVYQETLPSNVCHSLMKRDKNFTVVNICNKFNFKNDGINYGLQFTETKNKLDITTGNVLVIGYGVSQLAEEFGDVSVVGISANFTINPSIFHGDMLFQKDAKIVNSNDLKFRAKRILQIIKQIRGKNEEYKMPEMIVILRKIVDNDQPEEICEHELTALNAGCYSFDPNYKPNFLFAVTTNSQFEENVHQNYRKFSIAHHNAIKGTRKFTHLSVIEDELNVAEKELKYFFHGLCYGHQILTTPTSFLTPIKIAEEMIIKGTEIYKTLKTEMPTLIPRKNEEIDYVELTNMLGYLNSGMDNQLQILSEKFKEQKRSTNYCFQ